MMICFEIRFMNSNCEAQLLPPFFSILILFNKRMVFVLWLSVFSWTENDLIALCQSLKSVNLKAHFSFSIVRYCLQMKQNAASREISYSSHENFEYQLAWIFLFSYFVHFLEINYWLIRFIKKWSLISSIGFTIISI
jgi:hypothetical protein